MSEPIQDPLKGIGLRYTSKDGNHTLDIELKIAKAVWFLDHIIEITPIHMTVGDILEVSYDVALVAWAGNQGEPMTKTDEKPMKFSYLFKPTKYTIVQFVRLTRTEATNPPQGKIRVYQDLPFDVMEAIK